MRCFQRMRNLQGDGERFLNRQRAAPEALGERLSFDKLQNQEALAEAHHHELIDAQMLDWRKRPKLLRGADDA